MPLGCSSIVSGTVDSGSVIDIREYEELWKTPGNLSLGVIATKDRTSKCMSKYLKYTNILVREENYGVEE